MIVINRYTVSILAGSLLFFIGCILYISLGLTVIQDYRAESMYRKTVCTVRDTEIHNMNDKFSWYKCPWQCTVNHTPEGLKTKCEISEFPCLRIIVDVETRHGMRSAILHENPDKMSKYIDCSTFYCDRDSVVNERDVNKFRKKYGTVGSRYDCYYNSESLDSDEYDDDGQEHALLRLTYSHASYVNAWFWPSFCCFFGLIATFYGSYFVFVANKFNRQKGSYNNINKRRLPNNDL